MAPVLSAPDLLLSGPEHEKLRRGRAGRRRKAGLWTPPSVSNGVTGGELPVRVGGSIGQT